MINRPQPRPPMQPDRRGMARFGAAIFLLGLAFFGFGFGYPVRQAMQHQPGGITIHLQLLLLASFFLVIGSMIMVVALFNLPADIVKKPQPFWTGTMVTTAVVFFLGSWIGLVHILHHLGYP